MVLSYLWSEFREVCHDTGAACAEAGGWKDEDDKKMKIGLD
jgi:hypothetical protein